MGKCNPEEIKEVNGVRVCCSKEFLIGKGSDGTRVYIGLGKDGVERAVKRLLRDFCSGLAEQEKKVLNELNTDKVNLCGKLLVSGRAKRQELLISNLGFM